MSASEGWIGKYMSGGSLTVFLAGLVNFTSVEVAPVAGPALPCEDSESFWFSYWLEENLSWCAAKSSKLDVRKSLICTAPSCFVMRVTKRMFCVYPAHLLPVIS